MACICCCLFFIACENDEQEVEDLYKKELGTEEARDIELIYTMGGKTKAILTSPLMLHVQDTMPYYEFPNTLKCDFFNDHGDSESVLTAKYGRYKETQSLVVLRDSVKVMNKVRGDTLFTDELYWDRNRTGAEFYTDKHVRIRTKTQWIDGEGLVADQGFTYKRILKPTGPIAVPPEKMP